MCRSSAWPNAGWNLDSSALGRATASKSTAVSIRSPSTSCASLLRYVDGDYDDPPPSRRCARAGRRRAPGALSRHSADAVRHGRGATRQVGLRHRTPASSSKSRSAAIWPRRGRSTASCWQFRRIVDLPHRPLPRQDAGAEPALLPLRQLVSGADLEPPLRRQRADHDGRELRRAGARRLLRRGRRHPRRGPEPPAPGAGQPGDGAAGRHRQRSRSATRRSRC